MVAAIFAAAALVVGAASLFAAADWLKAGAYCVLVAALAAVWWLSLGQPRPVLAGLPGAGIPAGTVGAFLVDEPHAIYVWLLTNDTHAPLSLALPWNERDATALHDAAQAAAKMHARLEMRGAQTAGGNGRHILGSQSPTFYPAPNPPLPPKTRP